MAGFLPNKRSLIKEHTEKTCGNILKNKNGRRRIISSEKPFLHHRYQRYPLWVLNKNKKARVVEQNGKLKRYRNREDEILFMDLRQMGSPYEKKYIELTEEDRAKVTSVYHNWQQEGYEETYENVPEFCYSASFDEVKEKGFTLVPSRYIEFVNRDENIDFDTKMKSLQGELKELLFKRKNPKQICLLYLRSWDMKSNYDILGNHIRLIDTRNRESITDRVLGINIDKFFMPSVANVIGTDLSKYKLITKGKFACNPMHVGRDERLPVAMMKKIPLLFLRHILCLEVIDNSILNEDYLMMWVCRPEFDTKFGGHTVGSVRELDYLG